jgi:hypothetical protein
MDNLVRNLIQEDMNGFNLLHIINIIRLRRVDGSGNVCR